MLRSTRMVAALAFAEQQHMTESSMKHDINRNVASEHDACSDLAELDRILAAIKDEEEDCIIATSFPPANHAIPQDAAGIATPAQSSTTVASLSSTPHWHPQRPGRRRRYDLHSPQAAWCQAPGICRRTTVTGKTVAEAVGSRKAGALVSDRRGCWWRDLQSAPLH